MLRRMEYMYKQRIFFMKYAKWNTTMILSLVINEH